METFSKPNGIPPDLHLLSPHGRMLSCVARGYTGKEEIKNELKPASFLTPDKRAVFDLCGTTSSLGQNERPHWSRAVSRCLPDVASIYSRNLRPISITITSWLFSES